MQLAVPALVGACVAAAAMALYLNFSAAPVGVPQSAQPPADTSDRLAGGALSEDQRTAVEQTVHDYLLRNPQILPEMQEAYLRQQMTKVIDQQSDAIYRDGFGLVGGNPEGDVTIVEFSDYNCPFCQRAFQHVIKLVDEDKKVRVVMKEFPIFGERSEKVARVAIAAREQGKFFEMHTALMKARGQKNEQVALKIAEGLGLDMEKLRKDMESEEIGKIIKQTRELGSRLGIEGTPFYLVGDQVIPGAPDDLYEQFVEKVADIRKNGCQATC